MKKCCTCKEVKPLDSFSKNKSTSDGLNKRCKPCHNSATAKYYEKNKEKHNKLQDENNIRIYWPHLSKQDALNEYRQLIESQNNQCPICLVNLDQSEKRAHIDHDHTTGIVRGILCCNCNRGLGYLKDNSDSLDRAKTYLKRSKP